MCRILELILMDGVNDMKKEWWVILRVLKGHRNMNGGEVEWQVMK